MNNVQPPSFQPQRKRPRTSSKSSNRFEESYGAKSFPAAHDSSLRNKSARNTKNAKDWQLPQPWQPENHHSKQAQQAPSVKRPHSASKASIPPSITPRTRRSIKERMNTASPENYALHGDKNIPVNHQQYAMRNPATPSTMPPAYQPKRPRSSSASSNTQIAADYNKQPPVIHPSHSAYPHYNEALDKNESPKPKKRKRRTGLKITALVLVVLLIALIAWPLYLIHSVDSRIERVDALSSMASGSGETWLIAGSDKVDGSGTADESTTGAGHRSDTIMLVHKAPNGQAAIVSIPRDSAVEIAGHGVNKINAAYSFGGAPLLVETVESLTGIKVDHYIETSMDGLIGLVDAVGGVELCYDRDVNDPSSGMEWVAGCHEVNGQQALSYSRMRYQDPMGDIGRAARQRNVVKAVVEKAISKETILSPTLQRELADAGVKTIRADHDTGVIDIGRLLLTYRKAANDDLSGPPPIASLGYSDGAHGSMVLLDPQKSPQFWSDLNSGNLKKDSFGSLQ